MRFLIIGMGSSALRFINILHDKGHQVACLRHRKNAAVPINTEAINDIFDLQGVDAAIISSPTATHIHYAKILLDQKIPLLVEKPLSDSLIGIPQLISQAKKYKLPLMVGCNLRFLPIIQKIQSLIHNKKLGRILHADLYVGQYLPFWRPWLDYRKDYSSSFSQGGGVALDLIHEIDLALSFFPKTTLTPLISEKLSSLSIDTEDYVVLRSTQKPFIQVTLDYLHHIKTRQYRIVGSKGSINCDIFKQSFEFSSHLGESEHIVSPDFFDIKNTFVTQIDHFIDKLNRKVHSSLSDRELAIDALSIAIKARKHVQKQ